MQKHNEVPDQEPYKHPLKFKQFWAWYKKDDPAWWAPIFALIMLIAYLTMMLWKGFKI